jgi:hypothetical protein
MGNQKTNMQNEAISSSGKPSVELGELFKIVAQWVEKDFVNALFQFSDQKSTFKFIRVEQISKAWWKNDIMMVNALIRYSFEEEEVRAIELQINEQKQVLGFDLFEPLRMYRGVTCKGKL